MENTDLRKDPASSIIELSEYTPSTKQLAQLDELQKIVELCKKNNINYTVMGGYGLDGLLGKLTRNHGDIDMLVDKPDRMAQTLSKMGYIENFEDKDKLKRVFKNQTVGHGWKIEFGSADTLAQFTKTNPAIFFPTEENAFLNGIKFKTPTLEGQKAIIDIQNERAKAGNWNSYPHGHITEQILKLVENRTQGH